MNKIDNSGYTHYVITKTEFEAFKQEFLNNIKVEDFSSAPRFTLKAFRWYCHEYLGMTPGVIAHLLDQPAKNVKTRLKEMSEAASEAGVPVSCLSGYGTYIELADDIAREQGLKPKSILHMAPFNAEYQMWLVAQEMGVPNAYNDPTDSTAFTAAKLLDEIEGLTREEAVSYISQNYGIYWL